MIGFMGGLLAFPHCVGMCGGFMVHLAGSGGKKSALAAHFSWLAGKALTYTFAGAVAGYAGWQAQVLLNNTGVQKGFSYLAGGVFVAAGLALLGVLPRRRSKGPGGGLLVALCRPFLREPSPGGALLLGMITGLLPCPIVIGFLAYAMQSESVATGMATMGGLALGTAVPLLAVGGAGLAIGSRLKTWGATAGGIILVIVGLTTVLRGTEVLHHLMGCPTQPMFQQAPEADDRTGCCANKPHAPGNGK
jgi:sulfite exporter TauE/SafE